MTGSRGGGGQQKLRRLPSIREVDRHLASRGLASGKPVRQQVRAALDRLREQLRNGAALPEREAILLALEHHLRRPSNRLVPVINATGVVVHTNLGRALLAPAALEATAPLLAAYTNLELDLATGRRGERGGRVPELLATLSGAEQALVVNNNAGAVLLMLAALAQGREVIVSRGELVEIGGSFRIPDIMRQSGARLVEVGTTNRTRLTDYAQAITPETAALLKVHRSNFTLAGFVEEVGLAELAELAREKALAAWYDLGSGNFYRFRQPALRHTATVDQEVRSGADLVTFSGDKLLGSVQAGIVVGREEPVLRMRRHPLYRSLRVDKLRLALLEQSLLAYFSPETLRAHNPTIDLLERTVAEMEPLARRVVGACEAARPAGLRWELVREESLAGGGALPEARIETLCLALQSQRQDGESLAARLRDTEPPVIARVKEGKVLIDFRTVLEAELEPLTQAILRLTVGSGA